MPRIAPMESDLSEAEPPRWRMVGRRFVRHRLAAIGAVVFTLLAVGAIVASASPYDPNRTSLLERFQAPSLAHPFGTDDLGRDELTRTLVGGRLSLSVGVLATLISVVVGTLVGASAGYTGGWVDSLLMRLTEAFIVFPSLFILILLAALFGTSVWTIVLVIGLLRWMGIARLVRASFLQLKEREFVIAARALGASGGAIMWRHLLPNAMSPIIVAASLGVASAILAESTLSFLGLGIQLPTPTWGNMLRAAQSEMTTAPWLAFFPGFFIFPDDPEPELPGRWVARRARSKAQRLRATTGASLLRPATGCPDARTGDQQRHPERERPHHRPASSRQLRRRGRPREVLLQEGDCPPACLRLGAAPGLGRRPLLRRGWRVRRRVADSLEVHGRDGLAHRAGGPLVLPRLLHRHRRVGGAMHH